MAQKSLLIDHRDWLGQERLLKQAIAARPLFCGCEHYLYGIMLANVGRSADAVGEMRRSTEMLALDGISQFGLAEALVVSGKPDDAASHFKAAADLFRDPDTSSYIAANFAPETGDYAAGIKALADLNLRMPNAKRAAILAGFEAMAAGDAAAKSRAAQGLAALPDNEQDSLVTRLLGALGATREALEIVDKRIVREGWLSTSWLWHASMRAALSDPGFPALATRAGLIKYWRSTHTRPDVCAAKDAPPFCRMI